ncbi:MAG: efflux RND transporter periplasmic adaptor subunit [Verrucomicrobiota bacterium]
MNPFSMNGHLFGAVAMVSMLLGLGSGCGPGPGAGPSNGGAPAPLPPVRVRLVAVENHGLISTEEVVGTVRTRLRATVEAKVAGRIESLQVAPGQSVRRGEVLATLDARETQARLDSARAVLEPSVRDLDRVGKLLKEGAATPSEMEAVQSRHRVAVAAVTEMETMLGHARVVAPFDGVITRKSVDLGDLATPGRPLVEIEDPAHLRFEADVPEALIDQVSTGARLPVRIAARKDSVEGVVVEIAPVAEAVSRTYRVKLDLPVLTGLRSGQFGRVAVPTGQASVPHVPVSAVFQRGQMECVMAAIDGRARMRLIRSGKRLGQDLEVISGLEVGERVVVSDPDRVSEGQPLEVIP